VAETAIERARQASAAVKQWLDAQGKGGDPYKLMEQVMRQSVDNDHSAGQGRHSGPRKPRRRFRCPRSSHLNEAVRKLVERPQKLFPW
jgi:hypothetical protein